MRVLCDLRDDTEVMIGDEDEPSGGIRWTVSAILREQIRYINEPLLAYLLEVSAYEPEKSALRLSDQNLLHLLRVMDSGELDDAPIAGAEDDGAEWEDDWDEPEASAALLHHLPLTLHSTPHVFMSKLRAPSSSLSNAALTSLNLAYSTLPPDLDKLVNILPSGLRELSFVGVRFRGGQIRKADLMRGLAGMGRKLIVLTVSGVVL